MKEINMEEINLNSSFQSRITDILTNLQLSNPIDNTILQNRFLYEVMFYEKKRDKSKKYYNNFRFIVTTGSILLPAILSIGQMDPEKLPANFDVITYWASWIISLSVTACNGFLQLFSIDKQYFTYSIITEQLKTEGWQFVQLSGKYEQFNSHQEAYKMFCKSIETIKRKQIEQEFSSGKVDNKKKQPEFNFQKEMKNFQNNIETNTSIINKSKDNIINDINSVIQEKVTENITTKIEDIIPVDDNKQTGNKEPDNKSEINKGNKS